MSPAELHLVAARERPTLPPDAALCERGERPTLCPGLEQVVVDMGVLRHDVERIIANLAMLQAAQRETNTLLASLLERIP